MSVRTVPINNPPIIETDTTERISAPSERLIAMGIIPKIVVNAVIRTGLSLVFPASIIASIFSLPLRMS